MAVPTMYAKLMEAHARRGRRDARALGGGGARAAPVHQRLGRAAGVAAGGVPGRDRADHPRALRHDRDRHGAVEPATTGRASRARSARRCPGVAVDIVDEAGRPSRAGEPGELRVRSPQMFSATTAIAAATARRFDDEGRFRTGDTGVRDARRRGAPARARRRSTSSRAAATSSRRWRSRRRCASTRRSPRSP